MLTRLSAAEVKQSNEKKEENSVSGETAGSEAHMDTDAGGADSGRPETKVVHGLTPTHISHIIR